MRRSGLIARGAAFVLAGLLFWPVVASVRAQEEADLLLEGAEEASAAASTAGVESLSARQAALVARYRRFEKTLLQMSEYMRKTDPAKADLLVRAISQSKKSRVTDQMQEVLRILEQPAPAFGEAIDRQEELVVELRAILQLLQSEDRLDEIEREKQRIRDLLKALAKIIPKEKDLRAATQRGDDTDRLAGRQEGIAKETKDLTEKIDGQDGERSGQQGKNGKAKPGDGQSGQGESGEGDCECEGQPGEGTPGEKKPEGEKSDKSQSGKKGKKSEQGKSGEGKSGEEESESEKSEDEKSKENSDSDKSDAEKSEEEKSGKSEGQSGQKQSGQKQSGQQQSGQQQSGQQQSGQQQSGQQQSGQQQQQQQQQQQDGQQGQQQNQSGQQEQQQKERTPGREELEQALREMERAIEELRKKNRDGASDAEDEAIAKLLKAKEKLEEILRQLREEERELLLAALEARFQKMLAMQVMVYNGTVGLDKTAKEQWAARQYGRARELSQQENEIAVEASKALTLLKEEGSSVAFPEAVEQLREDMLTVARRLGENDTGELTQAIEQDIIEALQEVVEALQKELEKLKQQQQQQQQQGQPQDPELIDKLAELKMLRSLQYRVNRRTRQLGQVIEGEQATEADLIQQLQQLSRRQARIQEATYKLATGRTE